MMRRDSIVNHVKIEDVYELVTGYRAEGRSHAGNRRVLCPRYNHQERRPSCDLKPEENIWHCHSCGGGGGIIDLVLESGYLSRHLAGKERLRAAYVLLEELAGGAIRPKELRDQPAIVHDNRSVVRVTERNVYPYCDAMGNLRYEEIRIDGFDADGKKAKDVYGRVPLPKGRWLRANRDTWHRYDEAGDRVCIDGTPLELPNITSAGTPRKRLPNSHLHTLRYSIRLPFRLPEMLQESKQTAELHVVEGPKKCVTLVRRSGLCATTWYGGANEDPKPEWERYFSRFTHVVIWADDDPAGRDAAERRAQYFLELGKAVMIITLANEGEGYDVEDWLRQHAEMTREAVISHIDALKASRPWRYPE